MNTLYLKIGGAKLKIFCYYSSLAELIRVNDEIYKNPFKK